MNASLLPKPVSTHKMINNFIIIDDDSCHNIICALSLKKFFKSINILGFTKTEDGLTYLKNNASVNEDKTVLFLDINMPLFSGWQVLEKIAAMDASVKDNLIVYMLSSSISLTDKTRAFSFPFVKDCLEKPLSDHLLFISEELTEMLLRKKIYS